MNISEELLLEMHKKMMQIRTFESTIKDLFAKGEITGDLHLSIGQEAVPVGTCMNLRKDDYVFSNHRGHGHCIAKGADLKKMMAEFFGKKTGLCKGKGGSMHLADVSVGMLGATGIVGAGLPLAVGAGLSIKYRKTDQVSVCFFGDGASNQGTFHESINLAAIWGLPVIFVCENNQYAESTPVSDVMLVDNIADRMIAYGIPSVTVDGMDVIAVYESVKESVKRARKGEGPTLVECVTYRFEGHEEGDPQFTYRTREDVEEWKKRDPIVTFKAKLLERRIPIENLKKTEEEVKREIAEAVKFARESPNPDPNDAFKDIFVSPYY